MTYLNKYPVTARNKELFDDVVRHHQNLIARQRKIILDATEAINQHNAFIEKITKQRNDFLQEEKNNN